MKKFPQELYVSRHDDSDGAVWFEGKRLPLECDEEGPLARYRLVEVGELRITSRFIDAVGIREGAKKRKK